MSSDEVRTTLQNEADLLAHIIKCAEDFPSKGFTGQAVFIKNSWARFLGERRDAALALSKMSNEELQSNLLNELAQVRAYVEATHAEKDYAEEWQKFLECEFEILKHLVSRCDPC